ncbi:MarR family winged helix-turn-helix transcriptional regulator [Edaphobacter albus]|uniref:MarR family winged helix-turn-helix transcriptional regulator n=1 Tax=Edaphobacter sp. 4G125 TaxID=2763071 RepID=UPI0016468CEF|nr:MarR family transcriptional regulator [Edaphobacter sp. 4G125]QNI36933.1 MarR family transcriptional regulator [Edaphobacter sp. 4G125]
MTDTTQHEPDLSGIHLWLLLWKAARAVEAHSTRSIGRFQMGATDFGVLEALLHKGPLTISELRQKVLLTSGSMTTAVDRMETRGLVARSDDPKDRRTRIVGLTPEGRKLIECAFTQHSEEMEAALAGFSQQDRAQLLPLLRRLGRTAEATFHTAPQVTGVNGRRKE